MIALKLNVPLNPSLSISKSVFLEMDKILKLNEKLKMSSIFLNPDDFIFLLEEYGSKHTVEKLTVFHHRGHSTFFPSQYQSSASARLNFQQITKS